MHGDSLAKKKIEYLPHSLVPKHELVPEGEEEKILKKYNIKGKVKLPKIRYDDPGLKIYGIKAGEGNIIKIYRKDLTGSNIHYRVVVK